MALDVETGEGLPSPLAESYASVAQADAYHNARGNAAWTGADAVKEAALRRGTAYLDGKYRTQWPGTRKSAEQGLAWPRVDAVDIDGFDIADDVIPTVLIHATCEAALRELVTPGALTPDLDRGGDVKRERSKVDVIEEEIEYADGASLDTSFTVIENLLSSLIRSVGSQVVVKQLYRA